MLTYRELAPPARLAPFIRCFWTLTGAHDGGAERLLPDGSFELVVSREAFVSDQPRAMLMGEIRRPVVLHPSGPADVIGVRFRAGGAAPFFSFPMQEARDRMLALGDVEEGGRLARLMTGILPATDDGRVRHPTDAGESPAVHLPRRFALARAAVAEIRRVHGNIRIKGLASHLGTTERRSEEH